MALLNSLFSGVSGLQNHQIMMDTIGNNIANVNTIGYKSSRVTFSDTFNQFIRFGSDPTTTGGGTNTFQIGLGMKINSIDRDFSQGTFERTGITTDMALQGDALFILKNNNERFYSRAGTFAFDSGGNLVNTQNGGIVQGKMATADGVIPAGNNPEDLSIDTNLRLPAIATSNVKWAGNLNSAGTITRSEEVLVTGNFDTDVIPNDTDTTTLERAIYNEYGDEYKLILTMENDSGTNPGDYLLFYEVEDDAGNTVIAQTASADNPVQYNTTTGAYVSGGGPITVTDSSENLDFTIDVTDTTMTDSAATAIAVVDGNEDLNVVDGTVSIFDSLGNSHTLTLRFTKQADNVWRYNAFTPASSGTIADGTGTITFDENGGIAQITPSTNPIITFTPQGGAAEQNVTLDLGEAFDGMTQTASDSVASALSQNGSDAAVLSDLSIDQYGYVKGVFSNGTSRLLAQVLLASFNNPGGLLGVGDNMYQLSANSGNPLIGEPGENTGTTIQSGALEQSNVDLSEEFTRMIVAQRGFQANARVVTTSDTLLQEITNIVR